MEFFLSGLASGFDWKSMVEQLADVQRAPQRRLRTEQSSLNRLSGALSSLTTELARLQEKASALKDANLYNARGAVSSDSKLATASVAANAAAGTFTFEFLKLASTARQQGGNDAGRGIDANADLTTASAGFTVGVTKGFFSVNGKQIEVKQGDTLNDVLGRIAAQTGLAASYDASADKVTLSDSSGSPIVLGSAGDTSNFLTAARLSNNGTANVASTHQLGGVSTSSALSSARFNTAVTSGAFEVNGVTITVDAASDTVADVLNRISQSAAGVTASYDSLNDRFVLTNKVTGDIGVALAEGTSNFLSAAKLTSGSGGSLVRGQDAEFTVNGGGVLASRTNTLDASKHGIDGLTVSPHALGAATVTVSNETAPLKQAITDFIDQYNKVQKLIEVQSATNVEADGEVNAGILAGNQQVSESSRNLRSLLSSNVGGLASTLQRLDQLGFKTGGFSDEIDLENPGALESKLASSAGEIRSLFADEADGIATRIGRYLDRVVGPDGTLARHRDAASSQAARIDDQIRELEKGVLADRASLLDRFRTMERTLAQINQRAAFMSQRFGLSA